MKIQHICCNLAGSTVFPQLFDAIDAQGVEQQVFVPERRARDLCKNLPHNVPTQSALTVRASDMLFFFRKAQRTVPYMCYEVDWRGVTLVHAHTLFTDGSIARALCKRLRLPYIVTLRYSDLDVIWRYEPHLHPMGRAILRDAAGVVCLSEGARQRVREMCVPSKEREAFDRKTWVIPNGIDPAWLTGEPRKALAEPVRVGFAGLMNGRKRPLDALNAVHLADESGLGRRFVLRACGRGALEKRLAEKLREGDCCVGRVQGMEAMKAFYAGCDVLLVPSKAETFGMVYLEAMSQGVPVLDTRGQGFDGQFPEGEVGYSVKAGDVCDQADRLLAVCEGYAERSARCVAHAGEYAWPIVAGKWKALYEALEGNKPKNHEP